MKKLLLLTLCLLAALLPAALAEDAIHTSGNYQYTLLPDGTAEIRAYTGQASVLSLPAKLGGHRVTAIGNDAFSQCDSLTSVTVPEGVTRIGSGAFTYCYALESITLPTSLTSIGDGAFSDCMSLRSIAIPAGVTVIGDSTFYSCKSLTTITLPAGLKTIGYGAFYSCGALTTINIPDGVTAIGDSAFFFCESLTSVALPASVTSIGDRAFSFCADELAVVAPEGSVAEKYCTKAGVKWIAPGDGKTVFTCGDYQYVVLADGTAEIRRYNGQEEHPTVPATLDGRRVTSIGFQAFYCDYFTAITLPEGITNIGDRAFLMCRSLTSITLPDSITTVGTNPFESCTALNRISVSQNHPRLATIDGVLFDKVENRLICYPAARSASSYVVPEGVRIIGHSAFDDCKSLVSIVLPNTVTTIDMYAFSSCTSLSRINLPNSITLIDNYAFDYCCSLTSITLPDSITSISKCVFSGCGLTSIVIPSNITFIDASAFRDCNALTSIAIPDTVTQLGGNPFTRCENLTHIFVSPSHPTFATIDGVLFNKIEKELICYPCALTGATYDVPYGITKIGRGAFVDCQSLTTVHLPTSIIAIGDSAFSGSNITTIQLPSNLRSIGESAFSRCFSLTSITIPDNVTSIGAYAFYRSHVNTVRLGNRVATIGHGAFAESGLDTIFIPASVTQIGDNVFDLCSPTVTTPSGSYAAQYCEEHGIKYVYSDPNSWLTN